MIERLKELMLELIQTSNGITDIAMSLKLMQQLNPSAFTTEEFLIALKELLDENQLIVLSYQTTASKRANRILFVQGTTITFEAMHGQGSSSSQEEVARTSH